MAGRSAVVGLIPTGWYPTAVAVRPDGGEIYVVNGKSNTGPVPLTCRTNLGITKESQDPCQGANQYVWQREKAGFLTRDSRVVERKKYGKAKARRSFQFSKR